MPLSYLPSVKAAEDCFEYLLKTPATLDKPSSSYQETLALLRAGH